MQRREKLLRPAAIRHVEEEHPARVAHFRRVFARQTATYFVLRKKNLRDFVEVLRLVVAKPEDFRRRKAAHRRIADEFDQTRTSPDRRFDLLTFGFRALVVPQNRRADHAI